MKSTVDVAIPKTSYQYTYQLKTTPEIRLLEDQFKNLNQFVARHGWTLQSHRDYLRIRTELRTKCKEAYNKNRENKINCISENSKDSKQFWNKIKLLKGKTTTHTNYMKDNDGNKYFSDKEKCNSMEQS